MLRDASLLELSGELIPLALFTLVAMTAAALIFSKRLD
jgi:hypothetical protein